jgi:hypothetical protein
MASRMDLNPGSPPPDRERLVIHLCWEAERLRTYATAAGASAAARNLAQARDTLLQDILLDEALLTAAGPAQILALLGLRRSTR